jgi:hypothetical protein
MYISVQRQFQNWTKFPTNGKRSSEVGEIPWQIPTMTTARTEPVVVVEVVVVTVPPILPIRRRRLQQASGASSPRKSPSRMRRPRFTHGSLASQPLLFLRLLLLWWTVQLWSSSSCSNTTIVSVVSAEKDSNPYPWGENPNNQFKMYWNNAPNVVQDLDKFSALYIKFHGCVWSECSLGDAYDDDGENRDGGTYK